MNPRLLISLGTIIVCIVLWWVDSPMLGPRFPILLFIAFSLSIIPLVFGPTRFVRCLGLLVLFFIFISLLIRIDGYVKFMKRSREFGDYTKSLRIIHSKMIKYYRQYPDLSFTNSAALSDHGILSKQESELLRSSQVDLYSYLTSSKEAPLFRVRHLGFWITVFQNGEIGWVKQE